ncbi:putative endopeptidase [Povalibacter uvarum]|uniref:Putative endopeptidase n=1 Tax=Povalibacter uvarum TaxID=732238 RepID=A0A841HJK5_9GAMM|nr:M13 family metallopeptidase [Povalibacter uvarum]MBB6093217.1 putative endopeptidase [Povalibacter uvarum]
MKFSRAALGSAAALMVLAACSRSPQTSPTPAETPPPKAVIGAWGFDLDGMDRSIKPGDDFYKFANGKWLTSNTIPPDLSSWGAFTKLALEAEEHVQEIIKTLPANAPAGSAEQKVHDFYESYLDVGAIDKLGLEPARPALNDIAAAKTHADIAKLMGRPDLGLDTPINVSVTIDDKNPDRYIVGIGQSGLSLPERDYYLKDDPALKEIRAKYVAHVERMLALAKEPEPANQAKAILDLETQIAKRHWPVAKRRERELTYNLRTREQLDTLARSYPWKDLLGAAGFDDQKEFIVAELDAVEALGKWFTTVPVQHWQSYLKYNYLVTHGAVLPQAIDDERFDFYNRTLNGQQQKRERWKRAVQTLDGAVGEVLGQLYVKKYFPPESKEKMVELVENLRRAYGQRIDNLPWMTAETKKLAKEKLATFRPKIGYPDKWRDYSKLEIRAGDAFGNAVRARVFNAEFDRERLGRPTDKDEWFMTPQTVNAYYNPLFNEIVFPAAILQAPYFDPNADAAINYGGIGGVIGHEMGHGFDDQGAKSDARGILRTWWKPEDETAFKKLVDALVGQYDQFEALPGLKLNGRLTVGENIGDLGGLTVALEAYHLSLGGQQAPTLDGFTGEQRFFMSWAQAWRELARDESLRNKVMSDPHSPAVFRVQGVVRNMDAWYTAFDVKPEDKMYLEPEKRVRIW